MKKNLLALSFLVLIGGGCSPGQIVANFEECVAAGNSVIESYPRQCLDGDKNFVENEMEVRNLSRDQLGSSNFGIDPVLSSNELVYYNTSPSDIVVNFPQGGDIFSSYTEIMGEARGYWYFEASAPVELVDSYYNVIATGFITAQGDWMTTDFVDFVGTLNYTSSPTPNGWLIIKNDNPSGEAANDMRVEIPVQF